MARTRALMTVGGGGSLGKPWERFIAECWMDSRVISRITDSLGWVGDMLLM